MNSRKEVPSLEERKPERFLQRPEVGFVECQECVDPF